MKDNKFGLLLVVLVSMQVVGMQTESINNGVYKPQVALPTSVQQKLTTTTTYKLEVFTTKPVFTLSEDIVIAVSLFNPDSNTFIIDSVLISTPLSSQQYQLSNGVNQVTLDKLDFVTGANTITVSYKNQMITIHILRQDPATVGSIATSLTPTDILNSQPAPGVPNNITFNRGNSVYQVFPTEQNEYVQVSLTFNGLTLVLGTKFYAYNQFIESDTVQFHVPSFLALTTYDLNLSYSGDYWQQASYIIVPITVHDFTPSITTSLSTSLLDTSSVLNESSNYVQVNIEGFLPNDLQLLIQLENGTIYTLVTYNITSYRNKLPIPVSQSVPSKYYILKLTYSSAKILNSPVTYTYPVEVVQKVQLIVRKDVQFATLGRPVQFDFFAYDPTNFAGVTANITMLDGTKKIFTAMAWSGHVQTTLTFTGLDTSKPHIFTMLVAPTGTTTLYPSTIAYSLKFYHNSSVSVTISQNILEKKQLLTVYADNTGRFSVYDQNNLQINSFEFQSAGSEVNYFINLNVTHRGLNTLTIKFTPDNPNYSNVTLHKDIYVYDKITIQKVQTNASFYQLGSYILLQGVSTLGTTKDSLNGVKVSLLLGTTIIANTTIQTNMFTFIVPAPNSTGLKKYYIAIYADDLQFIVTSDLYEVTVSVINNFGLSYDGSQFQVGDSVALTITGQEYKQYELYYVLNGAKVVVKDYTYAQLFTFDLSLTNYGHYLIYLQERSTGEQCYYAVDVLQYPTVHLHYNILKTFTTNKLNISISKYVGSGSIKLDNLAFENNTFSVEGNGTLSINLYNVRPGNHSVTLLFTNQYTKDKVRTYYVTIYQRVELANYSYTAVRKPVQEGDTITLHLRFKEFTNESINDIPINIVTNEETILAQSNIFNSASDLQLTVIGNALTLDIQAVQETFVHEEKISLNIPVLKLISSDIKDSYIFDSATTLKIGFSYKYFPKVTNFTIAYQLVKDGLLVNNSKTVGQELVLPFTENGDYNLSLTVSGAGCVNRSYQTSIMVKKFFDVSNTNLVTALGILGALPVAIGGITVLKKKKICEIILLIRNEKTIYYNYY